MEAPGVETFAELQNGGVPCLIAMKKKYDETNEESRQMIDLLLKELLGQWSDYLSDTLRDNISNLSKQLRERIYDRDE
ncbi:MAG: hypothetical protein Q4B26_20770 [Eubacteriales bacterium]|nr:hypothetical protein [Eubacteriales bacterium]